MPYDLNVDHELRLVIATVRGDVSQSDVRSYNENPIWSDDAVRGYSELIDVTPVRTIAYRLASELPFFADSSARRDLPGEQAGCLLIVAAEAYFFGLARMYQSLRELHPLTQKKVQVFRTREDALAWLAAVRTSAPVGTAGSVKS